MNLAHARPFNSARIKKKSLASGSPFPTQETAHLRVHHHKNVYFHHSNFYFHLCFTFSSAFVLFFFFECGQSSSPSQIGAQQQWRNQQSFSLFFFFLSGCLNLLSLSPFIQMKAPKAYIWLFLPSFIRPS